MIGRPNSVKMSFFPLKLIYVLNVTAVKTTNRYFYIKAQRLENSPDSLLDTVL